MYDIILFVFGVLTARKVWNALLHSNLRGVVYRLATVVAVLVIYFLPTGYDRTVYTEADLPTQRYVVSDGSSFSDWGKYGITTAYSNTRGFLNSDDETPVLVYNPKTCTAQEARAIYRSEN